jgi:hypothetical protein
LTDIDTTRDLWRAFDGAWYRSAYPIVDDLIATGQTKEPADVYTALVKAFVHSPNPYFCESWYVARYQVVREAVNNGIFLSGFDHFCRHGYSDLMPHWLFDPAFYRQQFRQAKDHDLDEAEDGNPYDHFLRIGQHEGLTGHWLFDPPVYTAMAAFDVLARIRRHGPFTTFLYQVNTPTPEPIVSNWFDPVWYLARYPLVEQQIAEGKWSCALHHYLANNDPAAFDPSPRFSERSYVASWPDVAAAIRNGDYRNGLAHFILFGQQEQRVFAPADHGDPGPAASPAKIAGVTGLFPLTTRTFRNVTFLPCEPDPDSPDDAIFGVLDAGLEILPAFSHPWITMRSSVTPSEHKAGTFVYGGVLNNHIGHIICDGLAGFWFIREHPDLPILWHWLDIARSHAAWPTLLDEIWQIVGLDKHAHHIIKSPITVDHVILPESGFMAPDVLHRRQARALASLPPATPFIGNRVWLSRSKLPDQFGRIKREEEVEAVLGTRGWTIVYPEEVPVAGKVNLFATAGIIAGFLASAFHTVLLSTSPRARLILIDRPGVDHTNYDAVARALDLKQYYLSADLEPFTERHPWATFTLTDPAALADAICSLADAITDPTVTPA